MQTPQQKQAIIDYYTNLLIIQYHDLPRAKATMEAVARVALMDNIALDVLDGFDVDTAVGAQLDILAKYVGVSRAQYGIDFTRDYFNFASANGYPPPYNLIGFASYNSPVLPEAGWRTYKNASISKYMLTDGELRVFIKLKIILNSCNGSIKDIKEGLFAFFGTDISVIDNKDMTLTYRVAAKYNRLIAAITAGNLLPAPLGVAIDVIII